MVFIADISTQALWTNI
jgi:hypothetical protein